MTARPAGDEHWAAGDEQWALARAAPPPARGLRQRTEVISGETTAPLTRHRVLTDRLAAAVADHEPGWRLPRRSALARRYNASLAEIDAAIADLVGRSLVRMLPNGEMYRASPADYWIQVEGVVGLGTRLDPMGGAIACQARHVSQRNAPQDVAWALGMSARERVRVVRCVWSAGDGPAAVSVTYVPEAPAGNRADANQDTNPLSGSASVLNSESATAVSVELSPSHPSVARTLRLASGQPVITVTIRFADCAAAAATALTVVTLKPELFRVTIDTDKAPASAPGRPAPSAAPHRTAYHSAHQRGNGVGRSTP